MKSKRAYVRLALAVGLAAAFGLAGLVVAQSETKQEEKAEEKSPGMMEHGEHGMPGMMMGTEQMNAMVDRRAAMMKHEGRSDQEINQWKAMMSTQVEPDSPAGLLAYKDALKLTPDQVSKLEAIQKDAQQKAMAVLTDEQKAEFQKSKFEPGNVMQMTMHLAREMRGSMRPGGMMRPGMMEPGSDMKEKKSDEKKY